MVSRLFGIFSIAFVSSVVMIVNSIAQESFLENSALTSIGDSRGNNIGFDYGALEELRQVTGPAGTFEVYTDPLGRRTKIFDQGGAFDRNYSYNKNSEIKEIQNLVGSLNIAQNTYEYDDVGNISKRTILDNVTGMSELDYNYDATNQLIDYTSIHNGMNIDFDYDNLGNRLSSSATPAPYTSSFDDNNRLIDNFYFSFEYDNNGNLTKRTFKFNGSYLQFYWNGFNQLTNIEFYSAPNTLPIKTVSYFYGPRGRRIAKEVDGSVVEKYLYNGDNIHIAEGVDGERLFIYSDRIDEPLAMVKNGQSFYFHSDHLGSIQALTDSSGSIVEQYRYDAFGEMKVYDENGVETQLANSTSGNIFGYTGREFDKESPFYYYRARYYNPGTGRFISEDPIGFEGEDTNLYRYTLNNPLIFRDPDGLKGEAGAAYGGATTPNSGELVGQIIGGAVGGAAGSVVGGYIGGKFTPNSGTFDPNSDNYNEVIDKLNEKQLDQFLKERRERREKLRNGEQVPNLCETLPTPYI